MLVSIFSMLVSSCGRQRSPNELFESIRTELQRGQLDRAFSDADRAHHRYFGKDDYWAWRFLILKSYILVYRGSFIDSLKLLESDPPQSLATSDVVARRKIAQGVAHYSLQQYDEAQKDLELAEISARASQPALLGDVAQARGNLEFNRDRFPEAGNAFREVLAVARRQNSAALEASALGSLGNVAMKQEHFDEAVDWFRNALQKAQAISSLTSVAKSKGNIGWNYSAIGDFDNAEDSLRQAVDDSAKAGLEGDRVYWLTALAQNVYYPQRRYDEAERTSLQALNAAQTQDDKGTVTQCLNALSEIALATGRLDQAEKYNRQAAEIEKAGLDHFGIQHSELVSARIQSSKKNYADAQAAFAKLIVDPKSETSVKWEAHARLAEIYAARGLPEKAEKEYQRAIATIQEARNSVQRDEFRMSFLSSAIEFYDDYVEFLTARKRPLDALQTADLSRAQTLEEGFAATPDNRPHIAPRTSAPIRPQDIARRLNSTLLFYWIGTPHSYLWVITPAGIWQFQLAYPMEIDPAVKGYRQSFLEPRDPLEAENADGKKLYSILVGPAAKLIPRNSRVVVLPDGSLNSLNFETLIVPASQLSDSQPQQGKPHYWIEDVTITTANSLALLSRSSVVAPPQAGRVLVVGDALAASPDFPPLPQAGREVGLLENYFNATQRLELTGGNATATNFLASQPEKFSYLHFATHGTASRTRPLESAVILSPERDSYKLYARDVVKHPLNAYLVTISACNGAGTKSYAGEGLVGLSWAFLRAGAHHVIAGLWEVSNASTPQLMDELYKGLRAGEDPAAALRKAKLTFVHSNGNYRKPFYWAPFLLYSGS
jgi:CHAT domain-containing protein